MEKRELLRSLPTKLVYATEEPLILCEEVVGEYAEIRNTMHCFLMQGLSDQEVTVNCLGKVSDTERAALKVLEIPFTLTVVSGGEEPSYAYYLDGENGDMPVTRAQALEGTVIEEALLNMEDTGRYVWDVLSGYFASHGIELGQIDLRFGHVAEHFIVMCGELTPDTMHLTDPESGKRLWSGEGGMDHAYDIIRERLSK
jgi:hypothetical protein